MTTQSLDHRDVLDILPDRSAESHKGDYGKILLICGSKGYTGAAALAAMGALRAGAGLVYLAVPSSIYEIEAKKLLEPIVLPMPDNDGMFDGCAVQELAKLLPNMDAVLIGPGLGRSDGVTDVILSVLRSFRGPVVLDADGINNICTHTSILRERTGLTVITPHEGEFFRFVGRPVGDRIEDAAAAALENNCIVVLKGNNTVITDGTSVYINSTGNPGMAVGGSGDVLAGIIISLIGQGIHPLKAAACGAWLHGAAGDLCASQLGQYGMLPSDMLQVLPRLLK